MSVIDTSQWGEFLIGGLFELERPSARVLTGRAEGMIPFVSSGSSNNGVAGYVEALPGEPLDKGNCISVSAIDGVSFWQPVDFLGRGGSGASILLLRRNGLNDLVGTFLAGVITASINASYTDLVTGQSLLATQIKLPITPTGDPDWDVMEQTMREVTDRMATNLDALTALSADTTTGQIDTSQWGEFLIGKLFEVGTGSLIPRSELIDAEDGLPRVSVSGVNNGIVGRYVCSSGALRMFENFISVSFLGSVFYQPQEASLEMKVHALQPRGVTLTENTGSFLVACVEASLRQWRASSYSDQISSTLLPDVPIRLPVTPAGDPDWDVMEQTMRDVFAQQETALNSLQILVDEV